MVLNSNSLRKKTFSFLFATLLLAPFVTGCGLVKTQHTQPKAYDSDTVVTVTASRLNLRTCSSQRCRIIKVLDLGEEAVILAQDGNWLKIKREKDGSTGWLSASYVSIRESRTGSRPVNRKQEETPSPESPQQQNLPALSERADPPDLDVVNPSQDILEEELPDSQDNQADEQSSIQESIPEPVVDEFAQVEDIPVIPTGNEQPEEVSVSDIVVAPPTQDRPEEEFMSEDKTDPVQDNPQDSLQIEDEFAE